MLIDISEILSSKEKEFCVSPELGITSFRFGGVSWRVTGYDSYELHLSGGKSLLRIRGQIDLQLSAPCSRCLDDVSISESLIIDRSVDFEKVREAVTAQDEGKVNGKIIIRV